MLCVCHRTPVEGIVNCSCTAHFSPCRRTVESTVESIVGSAAAVPALLLINAQMFCCRIRQKAYPHENLQTLGVHRVPVRSAPLLGGPKTKGADGPSRNEEWDAAARGRLSTCEVSLVAVLRRTIVNRTCGIPENLPWYIFNHFY